MNLPASTGSHLRRNRSFPDPMTYYHEHHLGLTRRELLAENPRLYACLHRDRLLWLIPQEKRSDAEQLPKKPRASGDPLAEYRQRYASLSRGELCRENRSLYDRLRYRGWLDRLPGKTPAAGNDRQGITAPSARPSPTPENSR